MFEAVEEFFGGLQSINRMARVDNKFDVYSPQADVSGDAARMRLGIPLRNPDVPQGIPVAGVPVGEPEYERKGAERVARKVAADVDAITAAFKDSPHHMWLATRTMSSLSRFDYWHLAPVAAKPSYPTMSRT